MEKRTRAYTPDDWKALKAEQGAVYAAAFAALKAGKRRRATKRWTSPNGIASRIDRWFYPCSHTMHQGLASMYEATIVFRQSIDTYGEGLTTFLAESIRANAGRSRD
jgi:hypothetical protein